MSVQDLSVAFVKEEPKKTPIGNLETHGRWKIQLKLMGDVV